MPDHTIGQIIAQSSAVRGRCIVLLGFFAALGLNAQTLLSSGVPVPISLQATGADVLLNGSNGYSIAVPADTMRVLITLDTATPATNIGLYARCGSDVGTGPSGIVADAFTQPAGTQTLSISRPLAGQPGTCYIAPLVKQSGSSTYGRIRAEVQPFPPGTSVTVPAISEIHLAGEPDGTNYFGFTSPSNSPAQVNVPLIPGQALQIVAAGRIMYGGNRPVTPDGFDNAGSLGGFGIGGLAAPTGGLIGVFLAASIAPNNQPQLLFFNGGLKDSKVIGPLLQQPFFIGSGYTAAGNLRSFVVPTGATRLFLATVAPSLSSTGTYVASVSGATRGSTQLSNPLSVPAIAHLNLAGESDGTDYFGFTSPSNSPPQVNVSLTAGQALHIIAAGQIMYGDGRIATPEGSNVVGNNGGFGITGVAAPATGLIGVFLGPSIVANNQPQPLDFSGGLKDSTQISPLLQQPFYIGTGYTAAGSIKSFVVPPGAARLYLATSAPSSTSSGSYFATVSPDLPNVPQITPGGILNGAGFGPAPLTAGSIVSIFGSNFGVLTSAQSVPLPTILANTSVYFNDISAPLFFVSPTQINVQIPIELRGQTSTLVTVETNGKPGIPVTLPLSSFSPGVFTSGTDPVIVDYNSGQLVSSSAPAQRGDTLIIYASGLGLTLLDPVSGSPAPSDQLSPALLPTQVSIQGGGGQAGLTPAFAGLAPSFIGVYQINVQIPQDAPTGAVQLSIQSGSLAVSHPVMLSIR